MNECRWCVFIGWHRGWRFILRGFGWQLWLGIRIEPGMKPFEFYVGRFYGD